MSQEVDELKELVRRNIEISKETRDEVATMHRAARRATLLRWGWRLFILGTFVFGYYYFVLPYLMQVVAMYEAVRGGAEQAGGFSSQFLDFFKNFGR